MKSYYDKLLPGLAELLPDDHSDKEWEMFKLVIEAAHVTGNQGDLQAAIRDLSHERKGQMATFFAEVLTGALPKGTSEDAV